MPLAYEDLKRGHVYWTLVEGWLVPLKVHAKYAVQGKRYVKFSNGRKVLWEDGLKFFATEAEGLKEQRHANS